MIPASKKIVWVVACALCNSNQEILLAQRAAHRGGLWELPGGKIEANELPEAALVRELYEELGVTVQTENLTPLTFISHKYPEFQVILMVWLCKVWQGEVQANDGQAALAWVSLHDLEKYPLLEADRPLVPLLKRLEPFRVSK